MSSSPITPKQEMALCSVASPDPGTLAGKTGFMLTPRIVVVTLLSIIGLAVSIYVSALDSTLGESKDHHNLLGVYGVVSADFDWCERNHHYSPYIAEPFNSISSLVYCFVAIFVLYQHRSNVEFRLKVMCFSLFLVGVGSTLFHGTLQYHHQLLDELPMLYLILSASWGLYERNDVSGSFMGKVRAVLLFVISVLCSVFLALTEKNNPAHKAAHLVMVLSFAISLIYVFTGASIASGEHQAQLGKEYRNVMGEMFSWSFLFLVIALVSWVMDNLMCDVLHKLPIYPQLHALGWHLGTAIACYYIFLAQYAYRLTIRSFKYRLTYIYYCVPIIRTK